MAKRVYPKHRVKPCAVKPIQAINSFDKNTWTIEENIKYNKGRCVLIFISL